MATVVVLAVPPREGLVLPRLPETSPLSAAEAASLYGAMLRDVVAAADASGGDVLVNYRPDDLLPEEHRREADAEAAVRELLDPVLEDPEEVRFEEQVGSTRAARVGNTVSHLLEQEDASSAAVADPRAPLVARTTLDEVAMKLRRSPVVLAPSTGGRAAVAAFAEPIDFEDALAPPALETLTDRAGDAGLDVDFAAVQPLVETGADLGTVASIVRARQRAGRVVPAFTVDLLEELGVAVEGGDGEAVVATGTDNS